jgi:hypothetical protein
MLQQAAPQASFLPPDWKGDPKSHLEELRAYAEAAIQNELAWYMRKKKGRSGPSRALRFGAICLTVLGGLVPLLISVFPSPPAWPWLEPFSELRFGQLGYVLLAMAGGLVLLDRYFGFSTGWMRYIIAMQAIEKAREAFRLDWIALSRSLTMAPESEQAEIVNRLIERVRAVVLEVKEHVEKETQSWISEFQTNLAQFEKDVKTQMEAGRPGGIEAEVLDGTRADTAIELSLDGMIADTFSGTTGSIGFVAPGLHRVTARAQKSNRDYVASTLVHVPGGQICHVKLTLGLP